MDKNTLKEIKRLVKKEVANRPNGLIEGYRKHYKVIKYASLAFSFILLLSLLLPEFNVNIEFLKIENKISVILNFLSMFLIFCFSHLLTLRYNVKSSVDKDVWLRKLYSKFIPIYVLGFIVFSTFIFVNLESSPIKNLIVSFISISFIGFFTIVLILNKKPKYFTNSLLPNIGDFFIITVKWSSLQLAFFFILTAMSKVNLENPSLVNYAMWITTIILPTLSDIRHNLKNNKGELNITQKYVLRFIDPIRIINSLQNSEEIKASEIEALKLYLKLEKEGNLNKQKALLTYLNNKYQSKSNKIQSYLIGGCVFVIGVIASSFIGDYVYEPLKTIIEEFLKK